MFPTRDTVNSIGEFGAYSRYLTKRHCTELTKEMIELLNHDIKPSQRFITARALIGSVIIENHAEKRSSTGSTFQSTSVPSVGQNDFEIFTMRQTEGRNISIKLILGTHSFNALVTASTRINNLVDQPECGPILSISVCRLNPI
ncbi:uncharacterized protein EV154DRAFT_478127 [Mucor mucedo]|uniref:uncharacterized protein n=1 Tax=Mucor mucedo TaxID=29922 RepID=UPI00221EDB24|nr:uncharacterized protein EV154DRAFT_478127 [Mucor mucedo]KAI7894735.1 hypothetical protein EV154DRAFT_478127 [Mucor mucedo]